MSTSIARVQRNGKYEALERMGEDWLFQSWPTIMPRLPGWLRKRPRMAVLPMFFFSTVTRKRFESVQYKRPRVADSGVSTG